MVYVEERGCRGEGCVQALEGIIYVGPWTLNTITGRVLELSKSNALCWDTMKQLVGALMDSEGSHCVGSASHTHVDDNEDEAHYQRAIRPNLRLLWDLHLGRDMYSHSWRATTLALHTLWCHCANAADICLTLRSYIQTPEITYKAFGHLDESGRAFRVLKTIGYWCRLVSCSTRK